MSPRGDDSHRESSAPGRAVAPGSADNVPGSAGDVPEEDAADAQAVGDPLGVAAIVVGCIGLVAFGIVLAPVTALLAAFAGSSARRRGRSLDNAYIAFGLAALDGVVWLVLHMLFDLKFVAG